jgi:hypothetical protein
MWFRFAPSFVFPIMIALQIPGRLTRLSLLQTNIHRFYNQETSNKSTPDCLLRLRLPFASRFHQHDRHRVLPKRRK